MLLSEAKKIKGNVATLELINGSTITTKVTDLLFKICTPSVLEGADDNVEDCNPTLICKNPIEFQIEMVPSNPQAPPSAANPPRAQLVPNAYGAPLYDVRELKIDINHVIVNIETPKHLENAYNETVTGIVTAPAGLIK